MTSDAMSGLNGYETLLLSPHADDALFSAHALITAVQPEVWTVFAGEPDSGGPTAWDLQCGYDNSQELVRQRREEDEAAFEGLGVRLRHLPLLERAYTTVARRRSDLAALAQELEAWVSERGKRPAMILVPVGAGTQMVPGLLDRVRGSRRHRPSSPEAGSPPELDEPTAPRSEPAPFRLLKGLVQRVLHWGFKRRRAAARKRGMLANEDHLAVRDLVVRQFGSRDDVVVGAYEELPYLWGCPGDEQAQHLARQLGAAAVEVRLPVDRGDKVTRLAAYATQVRLMDPQRRRLESARTLPPQERLWLYPNQGSGA